MMASVIGYIRPKAGRRTGREEPLTGWNLNLMNVRGM
jgi:hypothetical protein